MAAYLSGAGVAEAGAFYYADQAPAQGVRQPFLEAAQASALAPDLKREWAAIAAAEGNESAS